MFKVDAELVTCEGCQKVSRSKLFDTGRLAIRWHDTPRYEIALLRGTNGYKEFNSRQHILVSFTDTSDNTDSTDLACSFRMSRLVNFQYNLGVPIRNIQLIW